MGIGRHVPFILLFGFAGCGSSGPSPETPKDQEENDIARATAVAIITHSTWADTAGLGLDLRLIERTLGHLDPASRDHLLPVEVSYFSFTDSSCTRVDKEHLYSGVLIVHTCVADDVLAIFEAMRRDTFPIAKVIPINRYGLKADHTGWNDAASMADNNTSAFNYRTKPGSPEPSKHAQGIDINPMLNPMVRHDSTGTSIEPLDGRYDPKRPGTLTRTNTEKYLRSLGWSWGGRWPRPQDHQHIEKSRGSCAHMRYSLK